MPRSNSSPDKHYAITRIDLPNAGTHGWQVRMQRHGVKYGKFFADRQLGGPDNALIMAQKWRDNVIEELTQNPKARICQTSSRNNSGVVGVSKITVVSSNGTVYKFWQATWSPSPGQRRSVKFSVKRHGDKQAFRLAVEARSQGVKPQ